MEANICDVNHLDADVLLPPRKRLLAGLKKQSSESDGALSLSIIASSASASAPSSAALSDFETRLNNLLSSHSNSPNLTPGEIVEASNSVAIAASKAAEAARAASEEKAAIASKARAAAKRALDLVASFSGEAACKERYLKKNKLKKHLPVQLLYKKYQPIENNKTDEELARKLHHAINSSPRISKNSSSSDWKGHKHKKPKSSASSKKNRVSNGGIVLERHLPSMSNGHAVTGKIESEGSIHELYPHKADEKSSKSDKAGQLEMEYEEAESSQPKDKTGEDVSTTGKRRGRVKLKRLPLSICNFRDQSNPKDEMNVRSSPLSENNMGMQPDCQRYALVLNADFG
ncbi:hypothetical protein F2P56_023520 [Juglans regia]|uniref:Uncharacterized protein LOC108984277 isoform X1 n=2 Tax=Juglans regia TaxID=51240 RepID=A0A2I4DX55_JUGRE|nr:uncharacterized protein LOC108984277 isoform X1 [Juglans regia]XP_018811722.2 uncharacterized protein LOC108984277 isoform X1 [Juglans regia]XP_035538783.1 uncharacterized protein LOC108984277 isoform X1 [Juglans regia]XP_035538784.1 uncharacterized protein LOC108984277 isoform X1 [Juglans regia]XP_035538785.1 uncharacterized protein LOC108984277 isoform X1 [Juglans regia]XP_035538786.1 uncharacterized protein LOC108984277 isoform X1 [Juglans regia]KAF5453801.1 hypothetical protein F2P56_0